MFFVEDDFDELQYLEGLRNTVVQSSQKIADIIEYISKGMQQEGIVFIS